jgi:hypothetical protein
VIFRYKPKGWRICSVFEPCILEVFARSVIEKAFFYIHTLKLMLFPDVCQDGMTYDEIFHVYETVLMYIQIIQFQCQLGNSFPPTNDCREITTDLRRGLLAISLKKTAVHVPGTIK